MDNILEKIANNPEYKLSEIWRYAGKLKIKNENVAEHSFYTALNIIKLGNHLNLKSEDVFLAVAMAVIHDVPEYLVGDLPYEFKVANPNIMEDFDILENALVSKTYKNTMIHSLFQAYANASENSIPRLLVDFGDRMSAWQFALREQKLGNTTEMMDTIIARSIVSVNDLYNKIKEVRDESYTTTEN